MVLFSQMLAYFKYFGEFCTVQKGVDDMKIKIFGLMTTLFLVSLTASAQSVAEAFVGMPAAQTPYLTKAMKEELVAGYSPGTVSKVTNRMKGETSVDSLSADYGRFLLSNSKELDIARLPFEGGDSIYMCIETYKAPDLQSEMSFYDKNWTKLSTQDKLPELDVSDFVQHSDSVTADTLDVKLFSPKMISYRYVSSSKSLIVSLTTPFLSTEEKDKIKGKICKRTLIWNGIKFN